MGKTKKNRQGRKDEALFLAALETMPFARALHEYPATEDGAPLERRFLELLASESGSPTAVELSGFRQTLGQGFTGGRSTPVYSVSFRESTGDGRSTDRRLVAKFVLHVCKDDPNDTANENVVEYASRTRSYHIEAAFYGDAVHGRPCPARAAVRSGLTLPAVLAVERGGAYLGASSDRSVAAICFVMEDLQVTHPVHPTTLSVRQAKCALAWLARFHARFWEAPKLLGRWAGRSVWEQGAFWAVKYRIRQQHFPGRFLVGVDEVWSKSLQWMQRKAPDTSRLVSVRMLGARLRTAFPAVFGILHGTSSSTDLSPVIYNPHTANGTGKNRGYLPTPSHVTLLHGDYKAANMFFSTTVESECQDHRNCAVCDFQYVGPGFGACDVAYLLSPDPRVSYFDVEQELLDWYHDSLQRNLRSFDKSSDNDATYSRELLEWHYRLAQIEFQVHMLAKGWVASSPNDVRTIQVMDDWLGKIDGGKPLESSRDYETAISERLPINA